jgi:excisionase family DNA binding protein
LKTASTTKRAGDPFVKGATLSLEGPPLSARGLADLCGVELKTVHNWVLGGRLEHFRTPGRHLRFRRDAVQKFLLSCGYEVQSSKKSNREGGIVVVKGSSTAALRTVLRGLDVTEVDDVPTALILAAKGEHRLLVIDLTPRRLAPDTTTLQALARLLPDLRVVLFGRSPQRKSAPLFGARVVEGVSNLVSTVQEFTSR